MERGRGTPGWVEEKLDRILVNEEWMELFGGARAWSVEATASDHLPLLLVPEMASRRSFPKRFRFENLWVGEQGCREVVGRAWARSMGWEMQDRIAFCGEEVWRWGKDFTRNFEGRLEECRRRMARLRRVRGFWGQQQFSEARGQYVQVLHQQHAYWKQRAKVFWYKGGDMNSRFFHATVKARRRRNHIKRLKNEHGV